MDVYINKHRCLISHRDSCRQREGKKKLDTRVRINSCDILIQPNWITVLEKTRVQEAAPCKHLPCSGGLSSKDAGPLAAAPPCQQTAHSLLMFIKGTSVSALFRPLFWSAPPLMGRRFFPQQLLLYDVLCNLGVFYINNLDQ